MLFTTASRSTGALLLLGVGGEICRAGSGVIFVAGVDSILFVARAAVGLLLLGNPHKNLHGLCRGRGYFVAGGWWCDL